MTLWITLAIMISVAAVLLSAPFIRRLGRHHVKSPGDIEAYRDQLKEVESKQRQGVIDHAQAETARLEIVGRALAAGGIEHPVMPKLSVSERNFAAICIAGIVVIGSFALYAVTLSPDRSPTRSVVVAQRAPEPSIPKNVAVAMQTLASVGQGHPPPQSGLPPVDEMVQRLAARLLQNPKDGQGWRTLGWSYFNIGRFSDASEAYAKAIELSPNVAEIRSARIEALVRSADGVVTTEAKNAIVDTLKIDPKNPRARFFKGLAKEQEGNKTSALTDWLEVLRDADPDEPWVPDLKNRINALQRDLGADAADPAGLKPAITGGSMETSKAPSGSEVPPAIEKEPSPQDVRAADAVPLAERSAMIQGMVDRLASRLEKSPRDADGWIKLIQSRMVLGETALAKQARDRGMEAFNDDTQQRDRIIAAAQQLGLNQ